MPSIDVDFDVYKAIFMKRPNESVTENDVLRQLLGLPPKNGTADALPVSSDAAWICKGVKFPAGTEFRAIHKGEKYEAKVEDGALLLNGEHYNSPSAAAMAITKSQQNGWVFWECRYPGSSKWQQISTLRK